MNNNYLLVSLLFISQISFASNFYDEHTQGWFWYRESKIPKEENEKSHAKEKINPVVALDHLQEELKQAKANAIMNPSIENVRDYVVLQQQVSDRASQFATIWKQVLLLYPTLDYSIQHPTAQLARQSRHDQQNSERKHALNVLSKSWGLFFFYRSTCPYCHRFAPILKSFANDNKFSLVPITLDKQFLSDFPDSKYDQGQALRFQISVVPALFAVNPKTGKAQPIGYGFMTRDELESHLYDFYLRLQEGKSYA